MEFSYRHKIKMNRLYREELGSKQVPYEEVDSLRERIRSRLMKCLKRPFRRLMRAYRKKKHADIYKLLSDEQSE